MLDTKPGLLKSAILKAPPSADGKSFSQYEAVFLQLADEHRTVNAFELQELLDACLPNGNFFSRLSGKRYDFFLCSDYIKSCASMEVCRQIVLAIDVSFFLN